MLPVHNTENGPSNTSCFKTDAQNSGIPKLEVKSSILGYHKQRKSSKSHIYTQCIGHIRYRMKIKAIQRLFSFALNSMEFKEACSLCEEWDSRGMVQQVVLFCENFFPNQDTTGDESELRRNPQGTPISRKHSRIGLAIYYTVLHNALHP